MLSQTVTLFMVVGALLCYNAFSLSVPSSCDSPDACKNARLFCPGIVIICNGSNQEIRPTGYCNCCNGCFNISQVGGPCGPSSPRYKCAKELKCNNGTCEN